MTDTISSQPAGSGLVVNKNVPEGKLHLRPSDMKIKTFFFAESWANVWA